MATTLTTIWWVAAIYYSRKAKRDGSFVLI
jgi:hypothetical protein